MIKRLQEVSRFQTGKMTYLFLLIGTIGILDSFFDVEGERILAYLPLFVPGLFASWYLISIAFMENATTKEFSSRFYFACFAAGIPLIIFQLLIAGILVNIPIFKNLVWDNYYTHAFWQPDIIYQFILVSIIMYFASLFISLFLALLIGLPLIALKNPKILLTGSILTRVEDNDLQRKLLGIVFFSLSSFIFGLIANKVTIAFFNAKELPYGFTEIFDSISTGKISTSELFWLIGWLLIALSAIGIIYAIIRFNHYLNQRED